MPTNRRLLAILVPLALLVSALTAGCNATAVRATPHATEHVIAMAPMDGMPDEVRQAPALVRQAYQFATANPDVLRELPCYCGCGALGHKNNYDCYIKNEATRTVYDLHATGCQICVDITQDALRLLRQGKDIDQIRTYVNTVYAKFGPPTTP